ncbi:MAG: permease prefix domain 1-containing protein [Planctomycetaceae bacterium]
MSEKEFELYLSLLSRFLRLKSTQRGEIADELRDHLEARLEELSRSGLSREDAIHAALEEFGDAAELAHHFTQIAQRRKRRFIMRCTVGTVAVLTAGILLTTAFWPANQGVQLPIVAMGQPGEKNTGLAALTEKQKSKPPSPNLRVDEPRNMQIELDLQSRIDVNFPEVPLRDAIEFLAGLYQVPILFDKKSLEEAGLNPDAELVHLKVDQIKFETALKLMLEPLHLTYRVWDGFLFVETQETEARHTEVQIHNCRDLIDDGAGHTAESLIRVIVNHADGLWEQAHNEGGTITEYNGLLIVRNTQHAQRGVIRFLDMLRAADKEGPIPRFGLDVGRVRSTGSPAQSQSPRVESRPAVVPQMPSDVPKPSDARP